MSVVWTIKHNEAVTKSLQSWGVAKAALTERNLDVGELELWFPRADVLAAQVFAYADRITLFADGVPRFVGTVTQCPSIGNSQTELDKYVVSNIWWQLSRTVYQQPHKVKNEDFSDLVDENASTVLLGIDVAGNRITTGDQIALILIFAEQNGVDVAIGALPRLVYRHFDVARDITCAEAIRRQVDLTPDVVAWVDYTGEVSTLHFARASALAAVEINSTGANALADFQLAPRNDLVPAGVVFIYEATVVDGDETWKVFVRDSAGQTFGPGVIIATIPVMGIGTKFQEHIPSGLALAYYNALQVLQWDGSLRIVAPDCNSGIGVGKVVNLSNGRAVWAAMRAVVQSVTEELLSGTTEVTVGTAGHLSPQDFVSQLMFNRRQPPPAPLPPDNVTRVPTVPDEDLDPDPTEDPEDPDNRLPMPDDPDVNVTLPPPGDYQGPDGVTNPNAGKNNGTINNTYNTNNQQPFSARPLRVCEDGAEKTIMVLTPGAVVIPP
ncbi:MAG: hypothetical protein ACREF9_08080 [Opitutaceae bacterium]